MQLYTVYVQGWGDREDEYYPQGTFKTRKKAEAEEAKLRAWWIAEGHPAHIFDSYIDEHELRTG